LTDGRSQVGQAAALAVRVGSWLRDEEAAGSNPATPTSVSPGQDSLVFLSTGRRARWCPILGAEWEPILVTAPAGPARSASRTGTIERAESRARSRSEASQRCWSRWQRTTRRYDRGRQWICDASFICG